MNLVIDDAVEVQQATKNQQERRRQLGVYSTLRARDDTDGV
jgi:small nuclear ribonucleoprotein (snRNP)-like protein